MILRVHPHTGNMPKAIDSWGSGEVMRVAQKVEVGEGKGSDLGSSGFIADYAVTEVIAKGIVDRDSTQGFKIELMITHKWFFR